MPLRHRNLIAEPAVFFITTSTYNRKNFPGYPKSLVKIQQLLLQVAERKSISIIGFVIMPNHLHLIVGSKEGGPGIARFIHSLKGMIRKQLVGNAKLWQERYDDLVLKSEKQFRIKLNYIHTNPVRAGLAAKPEDWSYSSYKDWLNQNKDSKIDFDLKVLE